MRLAAVVLALAACSHGEPPRSRLELVEAPATGPLDVGAFVSGQLAQRGDKHVVVYVGATWCEPCKRFHDAAAAGQLDAELGDLRLVVFDADRDGEALERAGYQFQMIPLFALPAANGTSSGKQIEGSVKGPGAIAQITPRLRALLE